MTHNNDSGRGGLGRDASGSIGVVHHQIMLSKRTGIGLAILGGYKGRWKNIEL